MFHPEKMKIEKNSDDKEREISPEKLKPDMFKQWFKFFDLRKNNICNDDMRSIIENHEIGTVLKQIQPTTQISSCPSKLRVLVLGLTGSGKTSFLVSLFTALTKGAAVQFQIGEVAGGEENAIQTTTMNTNSHFVPLGKKSDREKMFLELVDTRGFITDQEFEEGIELASGEQPTNKRMKRKGDDEYIEKCVTLLPQDKSIFHAVLLLIPVDLEESRTPALAKLRNDMSKLKIPVAHVFTKGDLDKEGFAAEKLRNLLNVNIEQSIEISGYFSKGPDARRDPDETINNQILKVVLWLIFLAETRGLLVVKRSDFEIQKEEVGSQLKQVLKAYVAQPFGVKVLIIAFCVALIALLIK